MRCADRLDSFQADKTPDAVFDVYDKIAFRQACRLGNDIGALGFAAGLADQPIAENILLPDKGDVRQLKSMFDPEHTKR